MHVHVPGHVMYIHQCLVVPPAAPVVIVTPETVAIVPVAATDASGRPVVATEDSIPISFQILPEQQVNGPVDK